MNHFPENVNAETNKANMENFLCLPIVDAYFPGFVTH